MKIIFDPEKRKRTFAERGLDMGRANEVLSGPAVTSEDDRRDYGETRYLTVGFLDDRMVVVVWTQRDDAKRIISMRKANDREQAHFGKGLEGPR
jgi:uncharacterized protein